MHLFKMWVGSGVILLFVLVLIYRKIQEHFAKKKYLDLLRATDPENMPEVAPGVKTGPLGLTYDPNDPVATENVMALKIQGLNLKHRLEADQENNPEKYLQEFISRGELEKAQAAVSKIGRKLTKKELKLMLEYHVKNRNFSMVRTIMELLKKKRLSFSQYLKLLESENWVRSVYSEILSFLVLCSKVRLQKYRSLILHDRQLRNVETLIAVRVALLIKLRVINATWFHQALAETGTTKGTTYVEIMEKLFRRKLSEGEKELLFLHKLRYRGYTLNWVYGFAFNELKRQLTTDDLTIAFIQGFADYEYPERLKEIRKADFLSREQKKQFEKLLKDNCRFE